MRGLVILTVLLLVLGGTGGYLLRPRQPSFPAHIICAGMDVHVYYQDMQATWGEFDNQRHEIHIEPGMPLSFEQHVLWHELKHCAVWNSTDAHLHPQRLLDQDTWIEASAEAEVTMLRENPALVRYLISQP